MVTSEIKNLYYRIKKNIIDSRLKESLADLTYLIQQNGFGDDYNSLIQIEENYKIMLQYKFDGYQDPQSVDVLNKIKKNCITLTDKSFYKWMEIHDSSLYFIRKRKIGAVSKLDVKNVLSKLENLKENKKLTALIEDENERNNKILDLEKNKESLVKDLFNRIWLSYGDEDNKNIIQSIFDSECLDKYDRALLVSAILLSLSNFFDSELFISLIFLCKDREKEVSSRAYVSLAFVSYMYDKRIRFYPEVKSALSSFFDDKDNVDIFYSVIRQLIKSQNTETVTKKMQEEILPKMQNISMEIMDKLGNEDGDLNNANPEWKKLDENNDLSDEIEAISEMQKEGVDVYMSTFRGLKFYPFFNDMENWFLSFNPENTFISELFNGVDNKQSILSVVVKSANLCSSDKYSFCFNILQLPEQYRNQAILNMGAESEELSKTLESDKIFSGKLTIEKLSNQYIQDLYRFFNLFRRKKDFFNIFSMPLDFFNCENLKEILNDKKELSSMCSLYLKNKNYNYASQIIDILTVENSASSELCQKKGFCMEQMNNDSSALSEYLKSDLINPNSVWTLKRIAFLYRKKNMPEKAIEYYQRAEKLKPDDYMITLNLGHTNVEMNEYTKALEYYFKVEIINGESIKTWRAIAWCSFKCGKNDQAQRYYEKVISYNNANMVDYLNAGHFFFSIGKYKDAIKMYKKSLLSEGLSLNKFMELFDKDMISLADDKIKSEDVPFLRDKLLYALEENQK